MQPSRTRTIITLPIRTKHGVFMASYSTRGLKALCFPPHNTTSLRAFFTSKNGILPTPKIRAWHRITTKALHAALAGLKPRRVPALDLSVGTPFQRKVWHALRRIPFGTVCTYAQVAQAIGKPGAARAVGNACRANPIPILIPCHRVIGAGGRLGGFSAGLKWKRKLLVHENAPLPL